MKENQLIPDNKLTPQKKTRQDTISLIEKIEKKAEELWIAYDPTHAWRYAKHIITAKAYGRMCERVGKSRIEFALAVMQASIQIDYWKWPRAWPKDIYLDYADVYNKARQYAISKQKPVKRIREF